MDKFRYELDRLIKNSEVLEEDSSKSGRVVMEDGSVINLADALDSIEKILELMRNSMTADWHYADTHPSGENAVVVVPGAPGKRHYIVSLLASFEADNSNGKVELLTNGNSIFESFITGQPLEMEFTYALKGEVGEDTTFRLINNSQNKATVFIAGYTLDD